VSSGTNHDALRVVRLCGQTAGFVVKPCPDGAFKVERVDPAGQAIASVKVSPRASDQQLKNILTRLKRIGWTEDLYDEQQKLDRDQRLGIVPELEPARPAQVRKTPEPVRPEQLLPEGPSEIQRRHLTPGNAARAKKATAIPDSAPQVLHEEPAIRAEIITPERALELLCTVPDYQRNTSRDLVLNYQGKMVRNEWVLLASDPLCIDTNSQLSNGQHRLNAVLESGLPQPFYVAYGVAPELYSKMDRGKRRTTADTLHGAGEKNAGKLAALGRLAHLWFNVRETELWDRANRAMSDEQIQAAISSNPGLRESVSIMYQAPKLNLKANALGLFHYLAGKHCGDGGELAGWWVDEMRYPTTIRKGDPNWTLREYLLAPESTRRQRIKLRPMDQTRVDFYLLTRAWDYTCQGRTWGKISFKPSELQLTSPIGPTPHASDLFGELVKLYGNKGPK